MECLRAIADSCDLRHVRAVALQCPEQRYIPNPYITYIVHPLVVIANSGSIQADTLPDALLAQSSSEVYIQVHTQGCGRIRIGPTMLAVCRLIAQGGKVTSERDNAKRVQSSRAPQY